ncbi:hypothetical protein H7347_05810 [Corynebacterium sp. zg-331]|uniref:hypothetical protein n=1 Tax=unclassified Corynebacterium TaxID=2624378 RepID=UPI00128CC797|nr:MULTISPECIES: hypothetical protein [unclassified Corynebacterium]MBC3186091.1 hypothetical protein [Corynebacterium sp. zg-331]MPV52581.1 hypothetical protein [Corynebacterium sp. zg331]
MSSYRIRVRAPSKPSSLVPLIALLVLGVLVRTTVAAQGWFYYDDLTLYAQAREHPLPDLSLLLTPHDGHLMPGSWLVVWGLAHGAPLRWPTAVGVLAAGNLAAGAAVAWAYRPLSRSLIPLAAYLFTPVTLTTSTWLAAGVNTLPLHAALALCLGAGIRAARAPSTRQAALWSLGAGAAMIAGALFSERALFLAPAVLLTLRCCGLLDGMRSAHRALVRLCLILPTALWAGIYALVVGDPRTTPSDPLPFFSHGYGLGLLPTLAGGPWHWERWHPGPPWAAPHAGAIALGAAAGLVLLALTLRRAVAWLPVALYPLLPFLALALARSGPDTAWEITQTLRHVSEVAVLAAVVLAFCLPSPLPRSARVLGAAWLASSMVSTVAFAQSWAQQPARDFFGGLDASLTRHDAALLDQDLPLEVLLPVTHPYNRLSHYSDRVSTATSAPVIVGPDGALHPARLHEMRATASPARCNTGPELPLDGPLIDREWVVRLNYIAERPGTGVLALNGHPVDFPIEPGLHSVYVQVSGGGGRLLIDAPGACLSSSSVGVLGV